ncbi:hypothetical protein Mapa_011737 [Marchantia paleacea]|nr:hypothetical protein Mapa_011737 [Marchantia paleacea]
MNSHTEAFSPSTLDDREAGPSNQKQRNSIQALFKCEILKISDSVYEIHKPSRAKSWMDILFFHDLYLRKCPHAHLSTWTSKCDDSLLWPKKWLADDYPDTRILCISFDASIQKDDKNGRMDMYLVVENLLQKLIIAGVGQYNPMLLIGHGLGGLVIKKLCLDSFSCANRDGDQQAKAFFKSIEGIFYYGTPHQGGSFSYPVAEELNLDAGDLVKCVKLLNTNLARWNHEFENLRKNHGSKWKFGGLGETLPTKLGDGVSVIVVPEASCRGGQNFIMVEEDHNSICKPRDKKSINYLHLTKLIDEISTSTVRKQPIPDDRQILPQKFVKPSKCLEDIKEKLKKHSCLALWGMGGIGKTTISKVVFNDLHHDFKFTLFKENVKLLQRGEKELEGILLADVHHNGRKPGRLTLNDLKAEDILVVLDDVEKDCHTKFICTLQEICSSKSRFILTSRDKQILTRLDDVSIVAVEVLDPQNSEKLFQSYAFSEDKVDMQNATNIPE